MAGVEVLLEDGLCRVDQSRQAGGSIHRFLVAEAPGLAHLVQGRQEQVGHRAEVVEDQALVAAGPTGDLPGARPGVTHVPEGLDGAADEGLARLLAAGRGRLSDRCLRA